MTAADFVKSLRAQSEVEGAAWTTATPARARIETTNHRDLVQAVAIVAKAAFDEARDEPHAVQDATHGNAT